MVEDERKVKNFPWSSMFIGNIKKYVKKTEQRMNREKRRESKDEIGRFNKKNKKNECGVTCHSTVVCFRLWR